MKNSEETKNQLKPKLGFCGIGWIGKNRLKAIWENEACNIVAAVDPDSAAIEQLQEEISGIKRFNSFEQMLDSDIEGVVIASPSALHASQALMALKKGKAVFCQKPLGRNEQETRAVVDTARSNDLLLGVDLSYRYSEAVQMVRKIIKSGKLGHIYGINLIFHNAFGPGKSWYYDAQQSGGGCVMDLGIHLMDLLFWVLDDPHAENMHSQIFHKGKKLKSSEEGVEDYAAAQFTINDNASVQFACSWNLPAGRDAVLEATFYGENGGISFRNLEGSFFHFTAEKYTGTSTKILTQPPDNWAGKAAVRWSTMLAESNSFDPEAETYIKVARALDLIYKHCS